MPIPMAAPSIARTIVSRIILFRYYQPCVMMRPNGVVISVGQVTKVNRSVALK